MAHGAGDYEAAEIEALLAPRDRRRERGIGLFLSPQNEQFQGIYDAAVAPAMLRSGVNRDGAVRVFGSESDLDEICFWIQTAQVIVADLTGTNPDVMYVLGLGHGFKRSPLLIAQNVSFLPFNLCAMRCVEYSVTTAGLWELRLRLERSIRVQNSLLGK